MFGRIAIPVLALTLVATSGCKDPVLNEAKFTAPVTLGGVAVPAKSLQTGREMYVRHCYACHGLAGDGRGPSAPGLRPAPRDLREARYKFGRFIGGDLPSDDVLVEILTEGLHGTAMLDWDIPEPTLRNIVQYIKTFSPEDEGWRDPDNEIGTPIEVSEDPWTGKADEAVARGQVIFHGFATCQSCHPAYATKKEIADAFAEFGKQPEFRDNMYRSEKQKSEYKVNGVEQWFLPPDYTWDHIRTGGDVAKRKTNLYRIIGTGIPGTAMAQWKGTLDEADLWAVAYYVDSLAAIRDTPAAKELRDALANQPEYAPADEGGDDTGAAEDGGDEAEAADDQAAEG